MPLTNLTALELNRNTFGGLMDRNRVKGTVDELVGVAKRKAGSLTGNTKLQVEGTAQQVKGKLENALGKATDTVRGVKKKATAVSKTASKKATAAYKRVV
jgi:uncharacterized protein YjbJ (UPF0337 family)